MNNILTATQMATELSQHLPFTVDVNEVQEALQDLGYVKKRGKKYMPTDDKGYYYCTEKSKQFGSIIKTYYLWNRCLLSEIAEVIREKHNK